MADEKRNVYVADTNSIFKDGVGTRDGIHPDSDGYVTYAEFLEPFIEYLMNWFKLHFKNMAKKNDCQKFNNQ